MDFSKYSKAFMQYEGKNDVNTSIGLYSSTTSNTYSGQTSSSMIDIMTNKQTYLNNILSGLLCLDVSSITTTQYLLTQGYNKNVLNSTNSKETKIYLLKA